MCKGMEEKSITKKIEKDIADFKERYLKSLGIDSSKFGAASKRRNSTSSSERRNSHCSDATSEHGISHLSNSQTCEISHFSSLSHPTASVSHNESSDIGCVRDGSGSEAGRYPFRRDSVSSSMGSENDRTRPDDVMFEGKRPPSYVCSSSSSVQNTSPLSSSLSSQASNIPSSSSLTSSKPQYSTKSHKELSAKSSMSSVDRQKIKDEYIRSLRLARRPSKEQNVFSDFQKRLTEFEKPGASSALTEPVQFVTSYIKPTKDLPSGNSSKATHDPHLGPKEVGGAKSISAVLKQQPKSSTTCFKGTARGDADSENCISIPKDNIINDEKHSTAEQPTQTSLCHGSNELKSSKAISDAGGSGSQSNSKSSPTLSLENSNYFPSGGRNEPTPAEILAKRRQKFRRIQSCDLSNVISSLETRQSDDVSVSEDRCKKSETSGPQRPKRKMMLRTYSFDDSQTAAKTFYEKITTSKQVIQLPGIEPLKSKVEKFKVRGDDGGKKTVYSDREKVVVSDSIRKAGSNIFNKLDDKSKDKRPSRIPLIQRDKISSIVSRFETIKEQPNLISLRKEDANTREEEMMKLRKSSTVKKVSETISTRITVSAAATEDCVPLAHKSRPEGRPKLNSLQSQVKQSITDEFKLASNLNIDKPEESTSKLNQGEPEDKAGGVGVKNESICEDVFLYFTSSSSPTRNENISGIDGIDRDPINADTSQCDGRLSADLIESDRGSIPNQEWKTVFGDDEIVDDRNIVVDDKNRAVKEDRNASLNIGCEIVDDGNIVVDDKNRAVKEDRNASLNIGCEIVDDGNIVVDDKNRAVKEDRNASLNIGCEIVDDGNEILGDRSERLCDGNNVVVDDNDGHVCEGKNKQFSDKECADGINKSVDDRNVDCETVLDFSRQHGMEGDMKGSCISVDEEICDDHRGKLVDDNSDGGVCFEKKSNVDNADDRIEGASVDFAQDKHIQKTKDENKDRNGDICTLNSVENSSDDLLNDTDSKIIDTGAKGRCEDYLSRVPVITTAVSNVGKLVGNSDLPAGGDEDSNNSLGTRDLFYSDDDERNIRDDDNGCCVNTANTDLSRIACDTNDDLSGVSRVIGEGRSQDEEVGFEMVEGLCEVKGGSGEVLEEIVGIGIQGESIDKDVGKGFGGEKEIERCLPGPEVEGLNLCADVESDTEIKSDVCTQNEVLLGRDSMGYVHGGDGDRGEIEDIGCMRRIEEFGVESEENKNVVETVSQVNSQERELRGCPDRNNDDSKPEIFECDTDIYMEKEDFDIVRQEGVGIEHRKESIHDKGIEGFALGICKESVGHELVEPCVESKGDDLISSQGAVDSCYDIVSKDVHANESVLDVVAVEKEDELASEATSRQCIDQTIDAEPLGTKRQSLDGGIEFGGDLYRTKGSGEGLCAEIVSDEFDRETGMENINGIREAGKLVEEHDENNSECSANRDGKSSIEVKEIRYSSDEQFEESLFDEQVVVSEGTKFKLDASYEEDLEEDGFVVISNQNQPVVLNDINDDYIVLDEPSENNDFSEAKVLNKTIAGFCDSYSDTPSACKELEQIGDITKCNSSYVDQKVSSQSPSTPRSNPSTDKTLFESEEVDIAGVTLDPVDYQNSACLPPACHGRGGGSSDSTLQLISDTTPHGQGDGSLSYVPCDVSTTVCGDGGREGQSLESGPGLKTCPEYDHSFINVTLNVLNQDGVKDKTNSTVIVGRCFFEEECCGSELDGRTVDGRHDVEEEEEKEEEGQCYRGANFSGNVSGKIKKADSSFEDNCVIVCKCEGDNSCDCLKSGTLKCDEIIEHDSQEPFQDGVSESVSNSVTCVDDLRNEELGVFEDVIVPEVVNDSLECGLTVRVPDGQENDESLSKTLEWQDKTEIEELCISERTGLYETEYSLHRKEDVENGNILEKRVNTLENQQYKSSSDIPKDSISDPSLEIDPLIYLSTPANRFNCQDLLGVCTTPREHSVGPSEISENAESFHSGLSESFDSFLSAEDSPHSFDRSPWCTDTPLTSKTTTTSKFESCSESFDDEEDATFLETYDIPSDWSTISDNLDLSDRDNNNIHPTGSCDGLDSSLKPISGETFFETKENYDLTSGDNLIYLESDLPSCATKNNDFGSVEPLVTKRGDDKDEHKEESPPNKNTFSKTAKFKLRIPKSISLFKCKFDETWLANLEDKTGSKQATEIVNVEDNNANLLHTEIDSARTSVSGSSSSVDGLNSLSDNSVSPTPGTMATLWQDYHVTNDTSLEHGINLNLIGRQSLETWRHLSSPEFDSNGNFFTDDIIRIGGAVTTEDKINRNEQVACGSDNSNLNEGLRLDFIDYCSGENNASRSIHELNYDLESIAGQSEASSRAEEGRAVNDSGGEMRRNVDPDALAGFDVSTALGDEDREMMVQASDMNTPNADKVNELSKESTKSCTASERGFGSPALVKKGRYELKTFTVKVLEQKDLFVTKNKHRINSDLTTKLGSPRSKESIGDESIPENKDVTENERRDYRTLAEMSKETKDENIAVCRESVEREEEDVTICDENQQLEENGRALEQSDISSGGLAVENTCAVVDDVSCSGIRIDVNTKDILEKDETFIMKPKAGDEELKEYVEVEVPHDDDEEYVNESDHLKTNCVNENDNMNESGNCCYGDAADVVVGGNNDVSDQSIGAVDTGCVDVDLDDGSCMDGSNVDDSGRDDDFDNDGGGDCLCFRDAEDSNTELSDRVVGNAAVRIGVEDYYTMEGGDGEMMNAGNDDGGDNEYNEEDNENKEGNGLRENEQEGEVEYLGSVEKGKEGDVVDEDVNYNYDDNDDDNDDDSDDDDATISDKVDNDSQLAFWSESEEDDDDDEFYMIQPDSLNSIAGYADSPVGGSLEDIAEGRHIQGRKVSRYYKKAREYCGDLDDEEGEDEEEEDYNDAIDDFDNGNRDDEGVDDFEGGEEEEDETWEELVENIFNVEHTSLLSELVLYPIQEEENDEEEEDDDDDDDKSEEDGDFGSVVEDVLSDREGDCGSEDETDVMNNGSGVILEEDSIVSACKKIVTWSDGFSDPQRVRFKSQSVDDLSVSASASGDLPGNSDSLVVIRRVKARESCLWSDFGVGHNIRDSCPDADDYKRRSCSMEADSLDGYEENEDYFVDARSDTTSCLRVDLNESDKPGASCETPINSCQPDESLPLQDHCSSSSSLSSSSSPSSSPQSPSSLDISNNGNHFNQSQEHSASTSGTQPTDHQHHHDQSQHNNHHHHHQQQHLQQQHQEHDTPQPKSSSQNTHNQHTTITNDDDTSNSFPVTDTTTTSSSYSLSFTESTHLQNPNKERFETDVKSNQEPQNPSSPLDHDLCQRKVKVRLNLQTVPEHFVEEEEAEDDQSEASESSQSLTDSSSFDGRLDNLQSPTSPTSPFARSDFRAFSFQDDSDDDVGDEPTTHNSTQSNMATHVETGNMMVNGEAPTSVSGTNSFENSVDASSVNPLRLDSGKSADEEAEVDVFLESPNSGLHRIHSENVFQQNKSMDNNTGKSEDLYKKLERSQSDASLLKRDMELLVEETEVHLTAAEFSSGQNISECNRVYLDLSKAEVFEKVELGENGSAMMRTSSGRLLETIPQDEELKTGDLSYIYASHRSFSTESSSSLEDLNSYGKTKSKDLGANKFKANSKTTEGGNSNMSKSNLRSSFQIYSHSLKQKVRQLQMGSLPEQVNALKELNVLMEQAWSMPVYGKDLAYELCDILRTESALDIVVGNVASSNRELMKVSARLLEQSLTTYNRRQVAETGLEMVVKMTHDCIGDCELAQVCTGILESLFKTSEDTCSRVIKLGGLDVITFWCRCNDRVTLKNCAIALSNLALYGGSENQQEMTKHKVPEWLFPLAFVEDDSVRYYALLAIGILVSNKEIENAVVSSGTLALVLPFVDSHDPAEFAQRDMSHRHGRSPGWLKRLIPVLSSKREEAQSLAAFHFVMEAGIKSEQDRKEVLYKIGAVEPLKWLASTPNRVASRLAGQALRIIGEEIPHKLSQQVPLWTIDDVVHWIAQVGFSGFTDVFQACQVDGDLLLRLSDEDLKESMEMPCAVTRKRFQRELRDLKMSADYTSCDPSMLGSWLRNVSEDMAQYTYQMLHAGLDRPLLRSVTNQHLMQDCGVTNGLHRMKIMTKIDEFRSNPVSPIPIILNKVDAVTKPRRNSKVPIDVFISYRRSNGSQLASLLKVHLQLRGFTVFIDIERLRAGKFDENLLESVKQAKNFIIVLTQNSLDRCMGDEIMKDWVHREITAAMDAGTNIIPLMDNFRWPTPDSLPEDMRNLVYFNGIRWIHDYQDACVDKLESFLRGESSFNREPTPVNGNFCSDTAKISTPTTLSSSSKDFSEVTAKEAPVLNSEADPADPSDAAPFPSGPTGSSTSTQGNFQSANSPPYQRARGLQGLHKDPSMDIDSPPDS